MAKKESYARIFEIGFSLGALGSFAIAIFGSSIFLLLIPSLQGGILVVDIVVGVIGGLIFGIAAVILCVLWGGLDRREKFVIGALVLLVGIAFFQPEIDLLGLLALLLASTGGSTKRGLPRT